MKTLIQIVLSFVLPLGFIVSQSNSVVLSSKDGITISIRNKPVSLPGSPQMPAYNPFYAELGSGNVLLGSYSNIGIVDVNITSTAGDDYSTVFDTSNGTIDVPISGYTGDYVLLITTLAGVEYVGEFSI